MLDVSETRTARSNVSDAKSSVSAASGVRSPSSEVHTNNSRPWTVLRTATECQICTQYPEIAWSVQQLCQKLWPTCYEEIQITRLDGGSYNRIFALKFRPSATIRPSVLNPLLDYQPSSARHAIQEDTPSGNYILRVSRGWGPDGTIEDQVNILSYVKLHTDLSIPRILAYDTGSNNDLEQPYSLQTRVPGVPLSTILGGLSFSQRLDLVDEIATIIKKTQKIVSPVPGKLGFQKSVGRSETDGTGIGAKDTSLEEKLAIMTTASPKTIEDNSLAHHVQNRWSRAPMP